MRLNAFLVGALAFGLSHVAAHPLGVSSNLARAEDNLNTFAVRGSTPKSKDKTKDKDTEGKDKGKGTAGKGGKGPTCKAPSKTPRSLFARGKFNCGDKIKIDGKEYTLGNSLGAGASGTVFELGETVKGHKAVAKEYSHIGEGKIESQNLQKVGQLITDATQTDGTVFAIMLNMLDGDRKKLYDWPAYIWNVRDKNNRGAECKSFMEAVREAVADEVADIAATKGIVHDDFTSSGNVLFSGQGDGDIKVTLIDWGKTAEVKGRSKAAIKSMALKKLEDKTIPLNAFKSKSASPEANAFSEIQCEPDDPLYDNPWK